MGITIASDVSANVDAGFSIVSYGGSTSGATVGHGLNSTPEVIIIKCTSNGSTNWISYHQPIGDDYYLTLNSNIAKTGSSNWLQPNSTTFALNQTFGNANTSGRDYIAYCFHSVDGYSKIGSYEGDGSSSGQTITGLGFNPRFLLVKAADSSAAWRITDSARGDNIYLYANLSNGDDSSSGYMSLITDGFKLNGLDSNQGSQTFIYMAFA